MASWTLGWIGVLVCAVRCPRRQRAPERGRHNALPRVSSIARRDDGIIDSIGHRGTVDLRIDDPATPHPECGRPTISSSAKIATAEVSANRISPWARRNTVARPLGFLDTSVNATARSIKARGGPSFMTASSVLRTRSVTSPRTTTFPLPTACSWTGTTPSSVRRSGRPSTGSSRSWLWVTDPSTNQNSRRSHILLPHPFRMIGRRRCRRPVHRRGTDRIGSRGFPCWRVT